MTLQSIGDGDSYWTRVETEEGGPVALVMTKQDARLIAAAPELLAFVESVWKDKTLQVPPEVCVNAFGLVRKARGEA